MIGVLDSGIGGLTVLKELSVLLPNESFIYFADSKNAPYGPKNQEDVIVLTDKIVQFFISKNCKLIVIACNTATAAAVNVLRQRYQIPIVGLEPAIKPACLGSKTGNVGVLATEGTFRGNHFKTTSQKYSEYINLHLQVAKGLVQLAEDGKFEGEDVHNLISKYVDPLKEKNIDYLVLGCTHYPLFIRELQKIAGKNIKIIDSAEAIARRVKDVLMTTKIFNHLISNNRNITFYCSGNKKVLDNIIEYLFDNKYDCFCVEI